MRTAQSSAEIPPGPRVAFALRRTNGARMIKFAAMLPGSPIARRNRRDHDPRVRPATGRTRSVTPGHAGDIGIGQDLHMLCDKPIAMNGETVRVRDLALRVARQTPGRRRQQALCAPHRPRPVTTPGWQPAFERHGQAFVPNAGASLLDSGRAILHQQGSFIRRDRVFGSGHHAR